ncbi:hypothetical protein BSPWISOXPB_3048 [uncultured Gammaproteobacteria bacterium]|nr:hypothetical protein BSPWISOXPB_3048 [uncultured Gammaproteobacteria bacterium]
MDGNTDGKFLDGSTTHTNDEQGAWWQVDLGSKKNISQIIIYNRTDCCANRLRTTKLAFLIKQTSAPTSINKTFMLHLIPKKSFN